MRLSPRDQEIVWTVLRFRQASASHLRRLHFADGSPASQGIRQRRSLARLTKWGAISRIPRPIGGGMGGSADYIYIPPGSRARTPDMHTLDITELYVRLVERCLRNDQFSRQVGEDVQVLQLLAFDPEPYCHVTLGHIELKPDAYTRFSTDRGTYRAFIEMDRATEWRTQLNAKMRRYNQAYGKWQDSTFPQALFIVPDDQRKRLVESVVKRQENPGLFTVMLFSQTLATLLGEP